MLYGYGKGRERADRAAQPHEPRRHAGNAVTSHWLLAQPSRNQSDRLSRSLAHALASLRPVEVGGEGKVRNNADRNIKATPRRANCDNGISWRQDAGGRRP